MPARRGRSAFWVIVTTLGAIFILALTGVLHPANCSSWFCG